MNIRTILFEHPLFLPSTLHYLFFILRNTQLIAFIVIDYFRRIVMQTNNLKSVVSRKLFLVLFFMTLHIEYSVQDFKNSEKSIKN